MSYLHGFCHEYVLDFGTQGDSYIVWTRWNDDLECTCLLHCFIKTKEGNYKDIRGITNKKEDVYIGFEDWDITNEYVYKTKDELKKCLKSLGIL